MNFYQSRAHRDNFQRYAQAIRVADALFSKIRKVTKRNPYVRASYFRKQKIFFDYFWEHLFDKNPRERLERLKYFRATVELLKNSNHEPVTVENRNKPQEVLHRFMGRTKDGFLFYVQVKENKKSGKKDLMSCFPIK